jgi:hypothetical protein
MTTSPAELRFGQLGRRRQADERRMHMNTEEYLRVHDLEAVVVEALKRVSKAPDAGPNAHIQVNRDPRP